MSIKFISKFSVLLVLFLAIGINEGCVTKKRKKDVSKLSKFYHNVTSEYNGYFNANELMEFAIIDLQNANVDNYTQVLELYDYISVPDPNMVKPDMDIAIEKVTRVAALHEPGDWVDDCYVLMGKAQYLKQDYDTAIETFEYFQEDFNPANPYGRNFQKKKISSKEANKQRKKERETEKKIRDKERKLKDKEREAEKKAREKARKSKKRSSSKKRGKKRPVREPKVAVDTTSQITSNTIVTPKSTTAPSKEETPIKKTTTSKVKDPIDKSSYNEGLVWLAKSMVRAGKYTSAEFLLTRLEKKSNLDKDILKEISVAKADILIKTNKEIEALTHLDEAINSKSTSREEKGRYAFVAGQILMKEGRYNEASGYFQTARKKSKNYKMKFMSELNSVKCTQLGNSNSKNVAGKLESLLKETKYEEFRDEIYFALGEIAANNNDIVKAKEYFSKSVASSKGASNLKTEAYYKLAQITYSLENYVDARAYYDSTSMVIAKTDSRRSEVQKLSTNLKDIADNIQKIERLDSVIGMASLSKDELLAIAKKRLEEEKLSGKKTDTNVGKQSLFVKKQRASTATSDFWAYNVVSIETGKRTFINKWGDRPLVDNWRQKSKVDALPDFQIKEQINEEKAIVEDNDGLSDEEYNRLMADVPSSALAKGKLEEEVRVAMFELGKQFRDKIQNYSKSATTLESLNDRFKLHKDLLDSYYYLFLDHQDLNNSAEATRYKNLILTDYPDSKYGKLIANPEYASTLEDERKKIDKYYDQTYALFQKGEYTKVAERADVAKTTFGKENKLIAKFSLLNAMAMGHTDGEKAYIKGLNEVILRYPNTPEELKAKEIMRFLSGDKSAFSDVDIKEVDNLFSEDEKARHYVAVILFDYSDDILQDAKISISDYNKKYHAKDRLQMGEMLLNKTENTQLILVRSFPNKEKAMEYYKDVEKNKEEYISKNLVNFELLPITQQNYRKMLQQKTHSNYKSYFSRYYLVE